MIVIGIIALGAIAALYLLLIATAELLDPSDERGYRDDQARHLQQQHRQELATVRELYPRVLRDCSAAETVRDGRSIYPTWNGDDAS